MSCKSKKYYILWGGETGRKTPAISEPLDMKNGEGRGEGGD